ncbi:C40 family peptidase [Clostridium tyrobutyricum]|nr:C40 family peptidase [Clostridium tyrobutyricum]
MKVKFLLILLDDSQAKLNETLKQIEAIRKATPKYTPSRGAVPVSSNAVVAYASNFLGTPYLWGGTTPAGFDCSGFTQYVYRHFGINLGRTTYNQIKDGYAVSRDELQPGDLVFYGQGGSPSHMGIYIGNGMYIHAPRTGDVVKISPYNRSDYITARRVMN